MNYERIIHKYQQELADMTLKFVQAQVLLEETQDRLASIEQERAAASQADSTPRGDSPHEEINT